MHTAHKEELLQLIRNLCHPLEPHPTGYPLKMKTGTMRAVIFDVYGTLFVSAAGDVGPDSAEDDEQAFRHALADGGWDPAVLSDEVSGVRLLRQEIAWVQEQKRQRGIEYPEINILQVWQRVLGLLQLESGEAQGLRRLAVSYECRVNPTWPGPGMQETLQGLRERGVVLGILSNAQFYTPLIFEALMGLSPVQLGFEPDLCLWSFQEGEGKPSPNLFPRLQARLQRHAIAENKVIYVGNDMLKDIWSAATAGFQTALYCGDKRSLRLRQDDVRVRGLNPDLVIDDLRQLLDCINR